MPASPHHGAAAPGLAAPKRLQEHSSLDVLSLGAAAAHAGLSPLHTDDDPRLAGAGVVKDQDKADTAILADLDGQRKSKSTLTAQLALRGYSLGELNDGTYIVCRWNLVRPLAGLDDVRRFAAQVGAA